MKKAASVGLVALTGCMLATVFAFLACARFDPCHEPIDARWSPSIASEAVTSESNASMPTLAPPPAVVTVLVQADKADIEVGWAEN